MEIEIIREKVKPPIKEVVLHLSLEESRAILGTIFYGTNPKLRDISTKLREALIDES